MKEHTRQVLSSPMAAVSYMASLPLGLSICGQATARCTGSSPKPFACGDDTVGHHSSSFSRLTWASHIDTTSNSYQSHSSPASGLPSVREGTFGGPSGRIANTGAGGTPCTGPDLPPAAVGPACAETPVIGLAGWKRARGNTAGQASEHCERSAKRAGVPTAPPATAACESTTSSACAASAAAPLSDGVSSVGILARGPLDEYRFNMYMRDVLAEKAKDIVSCGGVLSVKGYGSTKFVFKGAHEAVYYGPAAQKWKADEPRVNHVIFIGRGLDREALADGLRTCVWVPLPDGWDEFRDTTTKQPFYVNRLTGEKSWTRPEIACVRVVATQDTNQRGACALPAAQLA